MVKTGRRGFPDALYIKAGRVVFIEWKRGKKGRLSEQQKLRIAEMLEKGAEVYVCRSLDEGYDALGLL